MGQYTQRYVLENLQGLTTAKIYKADDFKHKQMNEEAEQFRRITIKKVPNHAAQLNYRDGRGCIWWKRAWSNSCNSAEVNDQLTLYMWEGVFVILISLVLPVRLLGSYFHIAGRHGGIGQILVLLDMPVREQGTRPFRVSDLTLSPSLTTARKPNLSECFFEMRRYLWRNALVGESGCGEDQQLRTSDRKTPLIFWRCSVWKYQFVQTFLTRICKTCVYWPSNTSLWEVFALTLPWVIQRQQKNSWHAREQVNLAEFVKSLGGLDAPVARKAPTVTVVSVRISTGQALLHNSQMCIFDEAASNIDVE